MKRIIRALLRSIIFKIIMDTMEVAEIVETKEKITPKDAFKEMVTGLLDLASGKTTADQIQPNFLNWLPPIDKYIYKRDEEVEFNAGETPIVKELESFVDGAPWLVYLKSGGGTTRLRFRKPPTPNSFLLEVTDPQNKTKENEVSGKLSQLAREAFETGEQIAVNTSKNQITFRR